MKIIGQVFEELVENLYERTIDDAHLVEEVSAYQLFDIAGYGNYIVTEDEIICIVMDGVAVFPYHLDCDMEYYTYRILELNDAYLVRGEDKNRLKDIVERYEKKFDQIRQYL